MDDQAALQALRSGDQGALVSFIAEYQATAFRVAFSITRDREAAEEAVQDGFLALYRKRDELDGSEAVQPWLMAVVANAAISANRRAGRISRLRALLARSDQAPVVPEDELLLAEQRAAVRAAVSDMSRSDRAVLTMRYFLDWDVSTIAKSMGWPESTTKTRLYRARARLRRVLEEGAGIEYGSLGQEGI